MNIDDLIEYQTHGGEEAAMWRARNHYPQDEEGRCICPTCRTTGLRIAVTAKGVAELMTSGPFTIPVPEGEYATVQTSDGAQFPINRVMVAGSGGSIGFTPRLSA